MGICETCGGETGEYCHDCLEQEADIIGNEFGRKIELLDNARMAAMHVLRTSEMGNSQERLVKAMEILESVEGTV